jgi:hypothetical protein
MDLPCYRGVLLDLTFCGNNITNFCRGCDWTGQIEFIRKLVDIGAGDILDFAVQAFGMRLGLGSRIHLKIPLLVT